MRLFYKFLALLLVLSIAPLGVIGYLAYENGRDSIEHRTFDHLSVTNTLKEAELERWLDGSAHSIELLAQRPLVKVYAAALVASYAPDETDPRYQTAYNTLLVDHLAPTLNKDGGFLILSILDPESGQILISTDDALRGQYFDQAAVFTEGKTHTAVQNAAYSDVENAVVMRMSTPILDQAGHLIAVMVGHLDLAEMSAIMLQGYEDDTTEETYLINPQGFFITNSRFMSDAILTVAANTRGVNDCLAQHSGSGYYDNYQGIRVLGFYRWIPEHNLCIVTEVDQSETLGTVVDLRNDILEIAGLIAVLVIAGAAWSAHTMTFGIRRLVAGIDQLRQGHLDYRVPVRGHDEITILTESFNQMAGDLNRSQTTLRLSEERFRILLASAGASISNIDQNGTIIFMNEAAAQQLGGTPGDFTGRSLPDLFPPDLASSHIGVIRRVIQSGGGFAADGSTFIAGELRWYHTSIQAVRDADGRAVSALVIANDITKRVQAETALREERDFMSAVINTSAGLILVLDAEGRVVRFNAGCEQLTGFSFDEVQGKRPWDVFVWGGDLQDMQRMFDEMCVGNSSGVYETHWRTRHDERRLISWANTCLTGDDGTVKYMIWTGIDITEHKRAEESLHELNETLERRITERTHALEEVNRQLALEIVERKRAEEEYHTILKTAVDGFWICDPDGKFYEVNDALCQMLGYPRDKLLTMSIADIESAATSETTQHHIRTIIEKGYDRFESKHRRRNGLILDVAISANYLDVQGGRIFVFVRDVTLNKAAEEHLRQSEGRFRHAIIDAPVPVIMHAEDGEILLISDTWTELTGYTQEDIPTIAKWTELAYGAQQPLVQADIERLYGIDHKVDEGEYMVQTRSGEQRIWAFRSSPLGKLPNGKRIVLSMAMDVTQRKWAEEALRTNETTLRALLNAILESVFLIDPAGIVLVANETVARRYTRQLDAFVGQCIYDLLPPETAKNRRAYAQQVIDTGQPARFEDERFGRTIDNSIYPVFDESGVVDRLAVYGHDITELKLTAQALAKHSEELARSNEELQQFAYVASHDLQEPLRMVTSYLQLLERRYRDQLDSDADEFIGFAVDGANRMKRLINDLLTYSRVGTHGQPFETVDCNAVLAYVAAVFKPSADDSDADITWDNLPAVHADESQLTQLFQNLIGNAIKFRGDEKPRIHISAERRQADWLFAVRDNGIGIDPEYFDRIFVIFQRLHTKAHSPGTGIGLAVCKKIVERHGGRIWVESRGGHGSTFYFTLPIRR